MELEDGRAYSIDLSGTYDAYPLRYRALRLETATFSCRYYLDQANRADPGAPILLLLHGLFDESWYLRRDGFHPDFRVASADLPAHGASGPSRTGFDIETAVRGLIDLLHRGDGFSDGGPVAVAGISIGSIVALRLAGLAPACIRGLILIEPPLIGERLQAQHAHITDRIGNIPEASRAAAQAIARNMLGVPACGGDPAAIDYIGLFGEIRCPALIVHGSAARGGVCTPGDVEAARDRATASVDSTELGGGHNIHASQHEAIANAAKHWWRGVPRA